MRLSRLKIIKRLLLATLMATSLTWQSGAIYAEGASDNTITVTNSDVTINGTTTDFTSTDLNNGKFYFGSIYGGISGEIDYQNTYANYISGISSEGTYNNMMEYINGFSSSYEEYMIARIIGGLVASGNVSGNRIIINGGNFYDSSLHGDYGSSSVYGGRADRNNGTASDNIIIINDGNVFSVTGGSGQNAVNNQVIITGGTVSRIYGGGGYITIGNNGVGNQINGNTISISGGTIIGEVSAGALLFDYKSGSSTNSFVTNNVINIYGNPDLSNSTLSGAWSGYGNKSDRNNILNLAVPITVKNISYFGTLNFFLPKTMTSGGTMLTLTSTDGTNLSGTAIRAAMQGGSTLDTGDTVTLIQSAGTITTDSSTTYGKMTQAEYDAIKDRLPAGMLSDGVSLDYDMTIEKNGDNAIIARIGNATTDDTTTPTDSTTDTTTAGTTTPTDSATDTTTNSTATVPATIINGNGSWNRSSGKLLPQTQLIANSTVYPTLQLVDFMNDKLVDWIPPSSFDFEDEAQGDVNLPDVPQKEPKGYEIFITGSGGSFRTKTGSGSYIESTLKGFDVGFDRSIDYSNGRLVFAPIFEYATGDYDSYLEDGMHGKGSTKYMAGGLIGRKTFKSGLYIEASARGGKTERDFSSDTMTSGGAPVFVHYSKTSAPIFAGHLRVGKQLRLNRNNLLDAYGIYFHMHQGSMNVNLSTGEDYHFSSANAGKLRLGYRLTTRTSKISRIYTGLAFQYEHNSDAIGMYKGRRTPGTGNHGASGMLELGWMIRPNKDNPWMLDLNATGFVGHQRGLSGTIKLQKEF